MIGSIISAKCQEVLGQKPVITIDSNTRLAFSLEATESEFNKIISSIPQDWVLYSLTKQADGVLSIEIIPKPPRDPLAEIDKIKVRVEKLERR